MYKCEHFSIKELVSKQVYDKFGQFAWSFFDVDLLKDLDTIRNTFGSGIIINNWANGGNLSQCGLRENISYIVKSNTSKGILYCSAHTMGKAFDLHASNGKHEQLWNLVLSMIKNKKLKTIKRLENYKNTNGWVHVDSFQADSIIF